MSGLVRRAGLTERQRWTRSRGWALAVVVAMAVTLAPTGPTGPAGAAELGATVDGALDPLGTAEVTGVVQNSFDEPVPSVHVTVLDAATMASVGSALTDPSGHFAVGDLAPGTYLVAYSKGGFVWQLHDGAADQVDATPVVLEAGSVAELTATLEWTGGVSGTVTDDAGTPVVGGIVTATGPAGTRTATTAADGTYRMALPPGGYTVAFPTSVGDVSYEPQWWSAATTVDAATAVTVGLAGFEVADAQLIRPPSVWRGLVTDIVTGAPVPDAYISVSNVATGAGALYRGAPDGTFAISGLPEGTYRVWFSAPSTTPYAVLEGGDVEVGPGRVTTTDAALEPMMRLSGALVDPFGRPVPGAWVESNHDLGFSRDLDASDGWWQTKSVRGSVYIRGMAPGFVTTWYGGATSAETAVPLVLGTADRSGLDIVLEWTSGISGVLLAEVGGTAGGVTVTATGAAGTRSTATAADGTFALALPPGDYLVSFTGPGYQESWFDGAQALVDATPVTVAPDAYTAVDDVVPAGFGSVSGTVTGPGGEPVVGLRVLITNEVTSEYWIAHTDASGAYRAWGPTPGEYAVYFDTSRHSTEYLPEYFDHAVTLDAATLFTIGTSTDVTGVDAVLDPAAAISGTVSDGLSRPAALHVALVDPASGATLATVPTAADGSYAFTGLRPGDYLVKVLGDGVFVDEFAGGGDDVSTATRVPLALGVQVVIDITAHWLGGVTGTVQDETGAAAAGVRVEATSPHGTLVGFTAADGTYAFDLPAGVHQVSVTSTSTDPLYDVLTVPDVTVGTAVVELGARALTINYGSVSGGIRVRTYWGDEYYVGDAVQVTAWAADGGAVPGDFTVTAHGWFTLDGLPPGDYVILAEPTIGYYKAFYGDDGDDLATATRVTIGYGEDLTGLDIWVRGLSSVIANVSDPSGADVVGATVELLDRDTREVLFTGVTGDEGYAYFNNLLPDRYTYRASAPGHLDGYFYASPTFEDSSVLDFTSGGWHGAAFMVLPWAQAVHGTATVAGEPRWVTVRALRASDHTELDSAYTDENGNYEIAVPADDVILEFSRWGTITEYSGGVTDIAEATVLTMAVDEIREGVDADLDWASSISGTVRDETGAPRAGVAVLIDGVPRATTAADGTYSAPTEPGSHRVSFVAGFPYAPQYFTGVSYQYDSPWVEVVVDQERTGVDADLWLLPGTITGTVLDEDGLPLAGVTVTATAGEASHTAATDATGSYALVLPPGEYLVGFTSGSWNPVYRALWFDDVLDPGEATPVVVAADATTPNVDAVLQVDTISLTGTVRSSAAAGGVGIPGVVMQLTDLDTAEVLEAVTDAAGQYSFVGLPPGTYVLRADAAAAPGYVSRYYGTEGQDYDANPEQIWLWWGDTEVADVVLDRTVSVTGVVRDTAGVPLAEAQVDVIDVVRQAVVTSVEVALDGSFVADGLAPGTFIVRAYAPGRVSEFYADATTSDDATVLELAEGATVDTSFSLAWARWIHGVVTGPEGAPVPGATVSVTDWETGAVAATATTDGAGAYWVGVLPGGYRVQLSAPGFVSEYFADAPDAATATMVTLTRPKGAGTAMGVAVDAQLAWAQGISGTVVDEDGAAMAGVVVTAEGPDGARTVSSGADGGYALALPPGDYVVSFSHASTDPVYRTVFAGGALERADADPVAVTAGAYATVDARMLVAWVVPVFVDVLEGQVFYEEIRWLAERGLATGWPDGTFRPTAPITREALAAFLHRYVDRALQRIAVVPTFSDVTTGNPFYEDIMWLVSAEIASGWADGTFRPSGLVERQAMAAFLYRLAGEPDVTPPAVSPFADVRPGDAFYAEICWLFDAGISTGRVTASGRYFEPSAPIERQAMAAFLYRFDGVVNAG